MADGVLTLKERHALRMERMARAIVEIDAALTAYAREHGGRFIRYGSTAQGRMRMHSDVDIIADFADDASMAAADFAESETGLKRILHLVDEELPQGAQSHADLLRRFRSPGTGSRPALLDERLFRAATELRKFRHVAIHTYDYLDYDRAALLVRDAEVFLAEIDAVIARFRAVIDPD